MDLFTDWIRAHDRMLVEQLGVTALLHENRLDEVQLRAARGRIGVLHVVIDNMMGRAIDIAHQRSAGAA